MTGYLASRFVRAAFTLWLVVTIAFVALRISGNPVDQILPDDATPELIAYYSKLWGVDKPLWEQYGIYWLSFATGDFGQSFIEHRGAFEMVAERLPQTLSLMLSSIALALAIGLPAGVIAALKRNTATDKAVMTFAVSGHAMPNFFLGIILILVFAVSLRWLPSSGRDSPLSLILPVFTLGTATAGALARFTRGAVLEALGNDHVRAALARGHSWNTVVMTDVLPNAAIPVVTLFGFIIGGAIGGAAITETVFAWPGVGRLLIKSVALRDFAVVQMIVLLIAATMISANLIVDILYGFLDPRIADQRRGGQS